MGAILQFDDGPVLIATCDHCPEQIVGFGLLDSSREEVEARIVAEGWTFDGDMSWLCRKCGGGMPSDGLPDRVAVLTVLTMPE